jgi:hypothetical protein
MAQNWPTGNYLDLPTETKEQLKEHRTHNYPFAVRFVWDISAIQFIVRNLNKLTWNELADHFGVNATTLRRTVEDRQKKWGDKWEMEWVNESLIKSGGFGKYDQGVKAIYLIKDGLSAPILLDAKDSMDDKGRRLYANKNAESEAMPWAEGKRERDEIRDGIPVVVGMEGEVKRVKGRKRKTVKAKEEAESMQSKRDEIRHTQPLMKEMEEMEEPVKPQLPKNPPTNLSVLTPKPTTTLPEKQDCISLEEMTAIDEERHRKLRLQMIGANNESIPLLASRHYWPLIKSQFSKSELTFFEQEWYALMSQFASHGILYTDENMVNDLITTSIMVNRIMEKRQRMVQQIEELEGELLILEEGDDVDAVRATMIRNTLTGLYSAIETYSNEYLKLQQGKEKFLKGLKATREQRIQQIEESKSDLFTRIQLLDELEAREREGRRMAVMKEAVNREEGKLGELYDYGDGDSDRPFLTPDTI